MLKYWTDSWAGEAGSIGSNQPTSQPRDGTARHHNGLPPDWHGRCMVHQAGFQGSHNWAGQSGMTVMYKVSARMSVCLTLIESEIDQDSRGPKKVRYFARPSSLYTIRNLDKTIASAFATRWSGARPDTLWSCSSSWTHNISSGIDGGDSSPRPPDSATLNPALTLTVMPARTSLAGFRSTTNRGCEREIRVWSNRDVAVISHH